MVVIVLSLLEIKMALPETAQTIMYGDNILGTMDCTETDQFNFQALADDRVVMYVTECSDFGGVCRGVACFCFDQCVELRDDQNNLLARNCTPIESNRHHRYRTRLGVEKLSLDDNYTIIVEDANNLGRGTYTLFLQRTNNPSRAETLVSGSNILMSLNTCGEVDSFVFNALAGDQVNIEMIKETGDIDPRVELYDSDGNTIAIPDIGLIDQKVMTSGTFTLLAYSKVNETGTYRITLMINDTNYEYGDSDGDGVINLWDKCLNTRPGFLVNSQGCSGKPKVVVIPLVE